MDHLKKGDPRIPQEAPEAFISREMSWLCFARRVLNLAEDPEAPLLERVKFAGIMGMIYDEFAMKRLGGLRRLLQKKKESPLPGRPQTLGGTSVVQDGTDPAAEDFGRPGSASTAPCPESRRYPDSRSQGSKRIAKRRTEPLF